jgi:integrase
MGFSKRYVFHSIRKTFTTQLENAGVTENVTADIVGHEKPRMTYGLYSGGTTLEVKREAINKIKFNFSPNPKSI